MQRLVLCDIDGTLTWGFEGHIESFEYALRFVHGIQTKIDSRGTSGLTDRIIVRNILNENGIYDHRIKEVFRAMIGYFKKTLGRRYYKAIDGAPALLRRLSLDENVTIGHVTGNLKSIAQAKMRRVGLHRFFTVGGYGCAEHCERFELVRIAIREAKEKHGFVRTPENVFLLGDTPRDVEAGKRAEVKTIAIAMGHFSPAVLQNSHPDCLARSYEQDSEKILDFIYRQTS